MRHNPSRFASFMMALLMLSSCKDSRRSATTSDEHRIKPVEKGIHFNLAEYATQKPELRDLGNLSVPGNGYLQLGDDKVFQVQANATADSIGAEGVPPQFVASVWISASVFKQVLGVGGKMIELKTESVTKPLAVRGIVRYRGQEKINRVLTKKWEQVFTRSLAADAVVPTPIPGLGVSFGANIGGEFGGVINPNIRGSNALMLSFIPRVALSAGVTGGVKTALFLGAEAFGTTRIIDSNLTHFAALGYHDDVGIAAGSLGIEDGNMTWLKGEIGIRAFVKPDMVGLPVGVDSGLWSPVDGALSSLGKKTWQYVLWQPNALAITSLPPFASFTERYILEPRNRSECIEKAKQFREKVAEVSSNIGTEVARLSDEFDKTKNQSLHDQIRAAATTKVNYQQILAIAEAECANL